MKDRSCVGQRRSNRNQHSLKINFFSQAEFGFNILAKILISIICLAKSHLRHSANLQSVDIVIMK